jgi:predicted nucleic acid-binding protein
LNRPFDDQSQARIDGETRALDVILDLVRSGTVELVASFVGRFENSRNADPQRQSWVDDALRLATKTVEVNDATYERARELERLGVKPMDALHLAAAEHEHVEWFITCDDRLMRRYNGAVVVTGPVEFVGRRPWETP